MIGSANSTFLVGADIDVSKRAETFTFPSFPSLVVTRMTPLAPREPYNAEPVASFIIEKLAISSGCRRARSVLDISTLSIKINGSFLDSAPKEVIPRTKNCALSCPGSPLR